MIGGGRAGISPMGVVRICGGRGAFGGTCGSIASGRPREFVGQGNQGHLGGSGWCAIQRLSVMGRDVGPFHTGI